METQIQDHSQPNQGPFASLQLVLRRSEHRKLASSIRPLVKACILIVSISLFLRAELTQVRADEDPPKIARWVPSETLESLVVSAFASCHDGYSVDEVLLHDQRREGFIEACRKLAKDLPAMAKNPSDTRDEGAAEESLSFTTDQLTFTADQLCAALLHVRKAGGRLAKATRRAKQTAKQTAAALESVAEIAARRLDDELQYHTDRLLDNSNARKHFDATVESIVGSADPYPFRRAALKLRKTRRLKPELLSRVTNWKRTIVEYPVAEAASRIEEMPERPGVYIFRDRTGYLYIGQAKNLRTRLEDHLDGSDRKALANYLDSGAKSAVTLEVHVFGDGSPGEDLRIRRAYESELIRTRAPRLNIKP